ncbi:MAG TPA: response regulator [Clostridiaceae bacterium]|nr:response regulator [Clostridiaceae bacterium]
MLSISSEPLLKMMIVDDEPLIRQGFKYFFEWDKYSISQVFEAGNAEEAIEIAKRENIEIIVSDIRMPEVDGLELISRLKAILPNSIYIILSGYDDFEYAKKSISLGVFHYLVKPIHSEELHQVMSLCTQKLLEQKQKREIEESLNRKLNKSMPLLRDSFIKKLLRGELNQSKEELYNRFNELEIDLENLNYLVLLVGPSGKHHKNSNADGKSNIKGITNIIKDLLVKYISEENDENYKLYAVTDSNKVFIILSWTESQSIEEILRTAFERLNNEMLQKYGIETVGCVSCAVKDLSKISIHIKEAEKILDYKVIMGDNNILFLENMKSIHDNRPFFLSQSERKKLIFCVVNNDVIGINKVIRGFKNSIKKYKYISVECIYSALVEVIISIVRFAYETGFRTQIFGEQIYSQEFMRSFNNVDEIFTWIEDSIIKFSNEFAKFRTEKPKSIIQQIKAYITENLGQEEITLNSISEKFYYNPSYLSRLFKEETNKNFIDYINEIKINTAKEYLTSTDMPISTICGKIGYKDYKHFLSLFKKITGVTPNEYKSGGKIS